MGVASTNPTAPLSFQELESLAEVRKGLMQRVIPAVHRNRLMSLGYIAEWTGILALTNAGRARLALNGRSLDDNPFGFEFRRVRPARRGVAVQNAATVKFRSERLSEQGKPAKQSPARSHSGRPPEVRP
jgi:hypothetical protein